MTRSFCVIVLATFGVESSGHAQLTWPPARTDGDLKTAGLFGHDHVEKGHHGHHHRKNFGRQWFSQPVLIPGEPTLNEPEDRTYNVHVSSGKNDWSRTFPWRAPGTAPVLGSGCGVSGGSQFLLPNGGTPSNVTLYPPGMDGKDLPARPPTTWTLGGTAEVAFALRANHGGGYSYRLCKKSENVTEACFQKNVLRFHGNESWLHYAEDLREKNSGKPMQLPRVPVPRRIVPTDKTHPKGSQWARNPIPSCFSCDQANCGGLLPNLTEHITDVKPKHNLSFVGGNAWFKQVECASQCSGSNLTTCPLGMTQFAEPVPGSSGWTGVGGYFFSRVLNKTTTSKGFPYSVVDEVEVPTDLEAGEYLLSWRWDAEQSPQIWQNCADITLVPLVAMV